MLYICYGLFVNFPHGNESHPIKWVLDFFIKKKRLLALKSRSAIRKMNFGKAIGPVSILVKLLGALEDNGIDQITTLLNEIYNTGQIPPDNSESIFIALPKKPGAKECELLRVISLISHITKLFSFIIMI